MSGSSIDLGTISATVALSLAPVTDAIDALKEQLAQVQGMLADFVASVRDVGLSAGQATEPVAGLDDALDAGSVALQALADAAGQADVALATVAGTLADAGVSADAASAEVDANTSALDANTDAADANAAGHKKAGDASEGLGSSMGKLVAPLAIAEAAIVGTGAVAIKMAGDFQESMTQLVTGAGESESNLKLVSDGILSLSTATGESTKQLAAGMYMIESAGYHGKAGLDVLKAAAEGAKVGNADLGQVANAATTILNDYAASGVTASNAVNTLTATVASGKTTLTQLAPALAQILPTAAAAKVSLNDVMGAMATMTGEGVPAANAATYLRQAIIGLDAPNSKAAKTLKEVGLSTAQVAADMQKSLPNTLKEITEAVGKKFPVGSAAYVGAIKDIAGGAKNMQAFLDLTGDHMQKFIDNTQNVGDTVKKAGGSIQGWAEVQKDFNTQLAEAGTTAQAALIQVGTALEPIAKQVISALMPALKQFGDWASTHGPEIAKAVAIAAGVIGVALAGALAGATAAFLVAQAAAIGIVAALGLVGAGVVLVVTHWQQIKSFFESTSPAALAVKTALVALGGALAGLAVYAVVQAIPAIMASVTAFGAQAVAAGAAAVATLAAAAPFILIGAGIALVVAGLYELITHWSQVSAWLESTWHTVTKAVGAGFSALGDQAHQLLKGIESVFTTIGSFFSGLGTGVHDALTAVLSTLGGWFASVGAFLLDWGGMILGWYLWPYVQAWKLLSPILHGIWQGISAVFGFITSVIRVADEIILKLLEDAWNAVYTRIIGPVLNLLKTIITNDWNFIVNVTRAVWGALSSFFTAVWTAIRTAITTAVTAIVGWLVTQWQTISRDVTAAWTVIHDTIAVWWAAITAVIQTVVTAIRAWLLDRWNAIKADVTAVWTTIHDDIASLWDKITSTIEAKGTALRDAILKPWNDAKGAIAGVVKGFANAAISELDLVIQGWADLGNDLGRVINTVAKAVGVPDRVPTLTLPTIPLLASGTAHHAGGFAVVGEEGPELVHLPKGTSVLPAGPTAKIMGYAGGVGDFFSSLGSQVSGLTGEVASLLRTGPAALISLALASLNLGALTGAGGLLGDLGSGALTTLRTWAQEAITTLLGHVSATASAASSGGSLASVLAGGGGRAQPLVTLASGGVLREAITGVGMSSGRSYLLGEAGQEAVVPLSQLGQMGGGDVNIYGLTVEVIASSDDGAPYQAGVAFGNGFAAGFQQARTQRGI